MLTAILLATVALNSAQPPVAPEPSNHRLALELGFSHWFGETFGSPDGIGTPAISVGVRPGVRFLELRARYAVAVTRLPLPGGGREHVGFASLELAVGHGLSIGNQRLEVYVAPLAALVHASEASLGGGLLLGTRWLFATRMPAETTIGVFFEGRQIFYTLSAGGAARRDGQMDIGVAATFF